MELVAVGYRRDCEGEGATAAGHLFHRQSHSNVSLSPVTLGVKLFCSASISWFHLVCIEQYPHPPEEQENRRASVSCVARQLLTITCLVYKQRA